MSGESSLVTVTIDARDSVSASSVRYETFEDFCRGEFDLAVNRAYQLIDGSRISTTVDKAGLPTPTAERQARELVPLLPPDPAGIDPSIALRNCGSPQTVEEVPAAVRYKASGGLYDDPESVIAHWLAKLDERAKRGR